MVDYIALDLETTGFSPETCDIIEIGAWKIKDGVAVDKFCTLVRPIMYIPRNVQELTGITMEDVKDCETIEPVLLEFYDWCERLPFLGHNLKFDFNFLVTKGKPLGLDFTLDDSRCGIDTLNLCKHLLKLESNKLEDVARYFNISVGSSTKDRFHRAEFDAYMTKLIYDRFRLNFSGISEVTFAEALSFKNDKYGKATITDTLSFT